MKLYKKLALLLSLIPCSLVPMDSKQVNTKAHNEGSSATIANGLPNNGINLQGWLKVYSDSTQKCADALKGNSLDKVKNMKTRYTSILKNLKAADYKGTERREVRSKLQELKTKIAALKKSANK